jgi:hypothetical protein
MYKLQRKNIDRSNEEAISTEDEATCMRLVVVWKINRYNEFCVVSRLIEHAKRHIWDREKLIRLANCYGLFNMRHVPIEETWLMHGNMVLMTRVGVTREEECYRLEMTISETNKKYNTRRPQCINVDRLVSMVMLAITFTY